MMETGCCLVPDRHPLPGHCRDRTGGPLNNCHGIGLTSGWAVPRFRPALPWGLQRVCPSTPRR